MLENLNSYWNKELLPILLENEKVYFHNVLELIAEKYICSIFGISDFLLAFIICTDKQSLENSECTALSDFCFGLLNLDFVGMAWDLRHHRSFGYFCKFDFNMHISDKYHNLIYSVFWDVDSFREMMLFQDKQLKKYEDSFIFLNNEKLLNSISSFSNVHASPEYYQNQCYELSVKVDELENEISQLKGKIAELEADEMQWDQEKNEKIERKITLANSDLLLISVLLEMLQNEIIRVGNKSQAKILQRIEDENKSIRGLSKSRTEKVVANANKIYKSLKFNKMK